MAANTVSDGKYLPGLERYELVNPIAVEKSMSARAPPKYLFSSSTIMLARQASRKGQGQRQKPLNIHINYACNTTPACHAF
jgi:hypothetical protein